MIYFLDDTNLLTWFDNQTVPVGIIHQANCFHTMGGGIAAQIARKYPVAYEVDKLTGYGDKEKLGKYSSAQIQDTPSKIIYNMYSQFTFGGGKQTMYDAMVDGLTSIENNAAIIGLERLGLPYNMGCKLGGGKWNIVKEIINSVFQSDLPATDLYICRYEPFFQTYKNLNSYF